MKTRLSSALGPWWGSLILRAGVTGLAGCAWTATAWAAVGGSLVATTDYVFRGVTQTDHRTAIQGDLHLRAANGWFGGAWGSAAVSSPEMASDTELNAYFGHGWTLTPDWSGSVHYVRYMYPSSALYSGYFYDDYDEFQVIASFQSRLTLSVALTPDIVRYSLTDRTRRRGSQWSYEGSFNQPVWRDLSVTASIGHYDLNDILRESYWAWSAGVQLEWRKFNLTLLRFSADETSRRIFGTQTADGRWALSAAWRF